MPYGETRVESGQRLDLGYTGHKWDAETKQYFAPYRYYSPANSRWISRDPLGFVDGPNVYGYVGGMPVIYYDPMGLVSIFGDSPLGEFGNGAADGALQACDVFNPFGDPFSGLYDPNGPGMPQGRIGAEIADTILSPSGKGKRLSRLGAKFIRHNSKKKAEEGARRASTGGKKPIHHANPANGDDPHFHPVDKNGKKKTGKDNEHHYYPREGPNHKRCN